MLKTNNFSEKAQYVTPSAKAIELNLEGLLCQSPNGISNARENDYGEF